jgi:hypothetical protein
MSSVATDSLFLFAARRRSPRAWRLVPALLAAASLAGCTSQQLDGGQSASYLVITSMRAASGATPTEFSGVLPSDVITFVKQSIDGEEVLVPTVYEDVLETTFDLRLKDPGTPTSPNRPTSTNYITINRYRVEFVRADGRNVPGVDVPYPFDGAVTLTVTGPGVVSLATVVRHQAKLEAPLAALAGGGGAVAISAIAQVTFYGADQAGHEVSVTGQISVNFADWGDPE